MKIIALLDIDSSKYELLENRLLNTPINGIALLHFIEHEDDHFIQKEYFDLNEKFKEQSNKT